MLKIPKDIAQARNKFHEENQAPRPPSDKNRQHRKGTKQPLEWSNVHEEESQKSEEEIEKLHEEYKKNLDAYRMQQGGLDLTVKKLNEKFTELAVEEFKSQCKGAQFPVQSQADLDALKEAYHDAKEANEESTNPELKTHTNASVPREESDLLFQKSDRAYQYMHVLKEMVEEPEKVLEDLEKAKASKEASIES